MSLFPANDPTNLNTLEADTVPLNTVGEKSEQSWLMC